MPFSLFLLQNRFGKNILFQNFHLKFEILKNLILCNYNYLGQERNIELANAFLISTFKYFIVFQVELKFFESWSKEWLKGNLKTYLDDINQLKKRRLDKDGLGQSANK